MKVVFIGAGNVATRLSLEMQRVGFQIEQIYSHTEGSAALLAEQLGCSWATQVSHLIDDADLYIFSLKDAVLESVIRSVTPNKGLWVHTAGSMPLSVFEGHIERYGVLYPLQTFSKERPVNFNNIPFFLETSLDEDADFLKNIASALSGNVSFLTSEQRSRLHLAAVFVCNFANHMFALGSKIVKEYGIDPAVLLPLIDETTAKIHSMSPQQAQTGPAVRYDENVIERHLSLLADEHLKIIYQTISQSIYKESTHE
ncbi:MAG: DUF2520 domain-containing protein [Tannerellaceae bacterium]|nr:DUF2520 domain-containing protein [Tannerellaceae bacterium]MCD8264224.1 DUF2520 domain-containing protein [Tannerellaceae bacterium]